MNRETWIRILALYLTRLVVCIDASKYSLIQMQLPSTYSVPGTARLFPVPCSSVNEGTKAQRGLVTCPQLFQPRSGGPPSLLLNPAVPSSELWTLQPTQDVASASPQTTIVSSIFITNHFGCFLFLFFRFFLSFLYL